MPPGPDQVYPWVHKIQRALPNLIHKSNPVTMALQTLIIELLFAKPRHDVATSNFSQYSHIASDAACDGVQITLRGTQYHGREE